MVTAVVCAGDGRAARSVYGDNKAFLELDGRALVLHVVAMLQRVPDVSDVWIVGDTERLAALFTEEVRAEIRKPLCLLEQFENLYQNTWQSYRRILPEAGPEGRDPGPRDLDTRVLYLSADIPFATPQEVSDLIRRGSAIRAAYVIGLVEEETLAPFAVQREGELGISLAYFRVREGCFRQNNLHLVQPARLPNRAYIEELYENRYLGHWRDSLRLAWKILCSEEGTLALMFYFVLGHLVSFTYRRGWIRIAEYLRQRISVHDYESATSRLLRAPLRAVITRVGGTGIDIDREEDFDAAEQRFLDWRAQQARLAEQLHGPSPLPATGPAASIRIWGKPELGSSE